MTRVQTTYTTGLMQQTTAFLCDTSSTRRPLTTANLNSRLLLLQWCENESHTGEGKVSPWTSCQSPVLTTAPTRLLKVMANCDGSVAFARVLLTSRHLASSTPVTHQSHQLCSKEMCCFPTKEQMHQLMLQNLVHLRHQGLFFRALHYMRMC